MSRIKWWITLMLVPTILAFGLGVFTGYRLFRPPAAQQGTVVTTQTILTALHDRGFLVSQTYVFDTPVTISKDSGNVLKDFFFGQTITARGTMEVNMGVDLGHLTDADVSFQDDSVTVRIASSTLFNTRLIGPVEVKNNQGVLKRLLNNDDGYNLALGELTKAAEAAAQRPELSDRANTSAIEAISHVLRLIAPGKTVKVEVRAAS